MADTYQHHVAAAIQLLRDTERLPRRDTDLKRIVVASARVHATLAHAAATREAGDAIVAALDQMGGRRRALPPRAPPQPHRSLRPRDHRP
jgi:hypothetical protein